MNMHSPGHSSEASTTASSRSAGTAAIPAEPPGALTVKELLQQAKSGEEVVAVGRVGEEVHGLAAFRLVDATLKACSEMEMPDATVEAGPEAGPDAGADAEPDVVTVPDDAAPDAPAE